MFHSYLNRRGVLARHRSNRRARTEAAARAALETLESRQLLTTHTFVVPTVTPPITSVYLRDTGTAGQVEVRRDSATGSIIHTFLNTTGMDVIDCGSISNFLFVDRVPAASKPTADAQGHDGIKVQGGSGGHLRIEAPANDERIRLRESTSTSATVEIEISGTADVANSRFGSGVNKLTIQTDPSGDASVRVATPENDPLPAPPNPQANDLPGLSPATALRIESLGPRDSIHLGGSENASVNGVIIRTGAGGNTVSLEQNHYTSAPHADGTTSATIDFDPTLGGGLGSDNQLLIGAQVNGWHCVATLARAGTGSHTIAVDEVAVSSGIATPGTTPPTVIVADPTTLGELAVGPEGEVSVEAPLTVTNAVGDSGTTFLTGKIEFTGTSNPSTLHHVTEFFGAGEMNLLSGADVTVLTSSHIGTLNIGVDAIFTLQERAPSSSARVLRVNSLFIEKNATAPEGVLDLKDNAMIIDYVSSGPSPVDDIQAYVTSGYNGGAWTGDGINSSTAADDAVNPNVPYKRGLGYGEATDIRTSFPATWDGQTIDATAVLVKYTYYGDANLDGMVNLADFNRVAADFGNSPRRWTQGDFNYDAFVGLADFNRLAANFGQSGLGDGNPADIEDISQEELLDMWEEATT